MNKEEKVKIQNIIRKRWNIINGFFAISLLIFIIVDIISPILPLGFLFILWGIINIINILDSLFRYKAFAHTKSMTWSYWCRVQFLQKDSKSSTPRLDFFFVITALVIELFLYIITFLIGVGVVINLHF